MKVVDMHCDTIAEIFYSQEDGGNAGLLKNSFQLDLERMEKGDYAVQNFALFTPLGRPRTENNPFAYGMRLLDVFYNEMEKNSDKISFVRSYQEIEDNMKNGKMSALLTLEEGGVCMGNVRLLRDFYRLGVRMMTLTWNFPNELGFPAKVTEGNLKGTLYEGEEFGLTEKGIEFVKEMERIGMIIDVSHLNDAGIWDVLKYTTKPFVASHSNAKRVCGHPRNLNDDLILAIAKRGGVIGLNYSSSFLRDWKEEEEEISKIEDMVKHVLYIKNLAGIDCIGLGSDFDGIDGKLEIASPEDLPLLEKAFCEAGLEESEIEKIFYKNVLRVYKDIL